MHERFASKANGKRANEKPSRSSGTNVYTEHLLNCAILEHKEMANRCTPNSTHKERFNDLQVEVAIIWGHTWSRMTSSSHLVEKLWRHQGVKLKHISLACDQDQVCDSMKSIENPDHP